MLDVKYLSGDSIFSDPKHVHMNVYRWTCSTDTVKVSYRGALWHQNWIHENGLFHYFWVTKCKCKLWHTSMALPSLTLHSPFMYLYFTETINTLVRATGRPCSKRQDHQHHPHFDKTPNFQFEQECCGFDDVYTRVVSTTQQPLSSLSLPTIFEAILHFALLFVY